MCIGDKAPDILGVDSEGNQIKLSDYCGNKLILYFYPKDNTSGCTAEACSLRDNYSQLKSLGYSVVGVSVDNTASHLKFISKHELPFPLIADTDKTLVEQMGVWGEKSMYGRKYMGTLRETFIFDENGVLVEIIDKVDTKNHAAQILK